MGRKSGAHGCSNLELGDWEVDAGEIEEEEQKVSLLRM